MITLKARITRLEKDMLYWQEAHLKLQNQLIKFLEKRLKKVKK